MNLNESIISIKDVASTNAVNKMAKQSSDNFEENVFFFFSLQTVYIQIRRRLIRIYTLCHSDC